MHQAAHTARTRVRFKFSFVLYKPIDFSFECDIIVYENGSPATEVDVLTPRGCAPFSFLFLLYLFFKRS